MDSPVLDLSCGSSRSVFVWHMVVPEEGSTSLVFDSAKSKPVQLCAEAFEPSPSHNCPRPFFSQNEFLRRPPEISEKPVCCGQGWIWPASFGAGKPTGTPQPV